ncbi:13313_t:CDS:2 [Rhizophagus irregularis]|nr:13313_t:CDS:2 [Rhizophagus irregularis]
MDDLNNTELLGWKIHLNESVKQKSKEILSFLKSHDLMDNSSPSNIWEALNQSFHKTFGYKDKSIQKSSTKTIDNYNI